MPAVMPDVRAAYQAIIDYGLETAKWMQPIMEFSREATAAGYPTIFGGQAHAPFDILADTLRGTKVSSPTCTDGRKSSWRRWIE